MLLISYVVNVSRKALLSLPMVACIALSAALPMAASAEGPSRLSNYLLNGVAVPGWELALGDETEWYQPQKENMGLSANKAISFNQQDNALHVKWRSKKKEASVSLNGPAINLSQLDDTIALAIEVNVGTKKLRNPIQLSMSCGYSCRGTVTLNPLLDVLPRNEWITLPIPLRCFKNTGTDFSKLDSPFGLQTKGKLDISIRNVRLTKVPEGFDLCKSKTK